jgi:phosphatidylglycerophosphate synthase
MMTGDDAETARRPIAARGSRYAVAAADWLARRGVRPNAISAASVVFAALAGFALVAAAAAAPAGRAALSLLAAAAIQARLLCNLLDGMVAIEGGLRTKSGEVWNDLPDRIADPLVLVAAGWSLPFAWGATLGWTAALLAVATAYVRLLGGAAGLPQSFAGPMAKQHRMAVMTAACVASAVEAALGLPSRSMALALGIVAVGSAATCVRRVRRIIAELERR